MRYENNIIGSQYSNLNVDCFCCCQNDEKNTVGNLIILLEIKNKQFRYTQKTKRWFYEAR